jgi:ComF family protein
MLGRKIGVLLKDQPDFRGVDLIVPIPLHKKKEIKRGYNQAQKLAEGISEITGIAVDNESIIRNVYGDSQTKMKGKFGRWENVEEVFEVTKPNRLMGRNILIVDDIITTGATSSACMERISLLPDVKLWFAAVGTSSGI